MAQTFHTIHTFNALAEGNTPYATLTQGADGLLYGTASANGPNGTGSVYRLAADGTGFTVLTAFPGVGAGLFPSAALVQARDGNFYGTTFRGGSANQGSLFQITPSGVLTYNTSFTDGVAPGANPEGTIVEGRDGLLYGAAEYGGANNFGTVYQFPLQTAQSITQPLVFATFAGDVGGSYPRCDLCLAADGNLYGTTSLGGQNGNGAFFRLNSNGGYTVLYSFTGNADGRAPLRGVVQGADGAFYGATQSGGTYGSGAVYRIVVNGNSVAVTTIHDFNTTLGEGSAPTGRLLAASDGNFYGTTTTGGANNNGSIFRVSAGGAFTTLYSFANGADGGDPIAGLIQGSDGKLYGTTAPINGANATIFQLDANLTNPTPTPQALLNTSAAIGDTILIQGRNFVGATAVNFTADDGGTVPATRFTVMSSTIIAAVVPIGTVNGVVSVSAGNLRGVTPTMLTVTFAQPPFFAGDVPLTNGVFFLRLPNNKLFGYYGFLSDPHYLYHFDLGYEYMFDAADGNGGLYLYDFASSTFFYTSRTYPFPYLYDFSLNTTLYYFADPNQTDHYTSNPRYFYNFGSGQIISK